MKICIVSPNYPLCLRRDETAKFAGAEVQAGFVAGALSSAGHDVVFVVANLRDGEKLPFSAENAYRSSGGLPGLRFFHPRLTGVCRALGRADADVYYQRNASMLTGVAALFCRSKGRVLVYGAGSDTDFSFRNARMDNFRDRVLFYTGLKLAHGVVVQNEFQKHAYLKKHDGPVRVIPNGIEPADCESRGPRDLVVWIGGIRRIKQPELFLELARRNPGLRFVLVGGGSGVEPAFERQIRDEAAGIENLEMTGHVPHDGVRDYLTRALLLVNTSRVEGFPNAYLEAWNLCIPVVSFNDVDGVVEKEGLGAICRGIDDMSDTVRSLSADAEKRAGMGKRARAVVDSRFSAAVLARHYVEFFEELVYRDPRARRRALRSQKTTGGDRGPVSGSGRIMRQRSCGKIHNIMILENHLGMGGLEKKLYDFVSRIDRAHYRVVACCLKDAGHLRDPFIGLGVPMYERLLKNRYDALAFARLLRIIDNEKIDLVYTLPHPNSVIFSSTARRLGRVKRVVVSVHGTGGPMGGRMVRRYLKPFFGGVDRFISVAEEHRRYLVETEELPPEKTIVIYNGVDLAKFRPGSASEAARAGLGLGPGEKVVTTVASLNFYKGVDVLVNAIPAVLERVGNARFVVVGDGPERKNLERLAADLGVAERVIFTGIRSDVDEILRASDVFVLSSRTEAFPNVILEAMATALPVVSSDVGSVAELVEEGKTGHRIPPEDPAELAKSIRALLEDSATAKGFGAAARRVVEDKFRLEGMIEKRESLFAELLCG